MLIASYVGMMNLKLVLNSILKFLFLATLISACGEPFRATLSSNENLTELSEGGSSWFDHNGDRITSDQVNQDQAVISQYWNEIQASPNRSEAINNMIQAFDLIVTPASNNQVQLTGRLVLNCSQAHSFQKTVSSVNLQTGVTIDYGTQGEFEMESQCTTERCDEMMVAIRKVSGSNRGLLLIPVGVAGATESQIVYVPRTITRTQYFGDFDYQHVGDFESENSCRVSTSGSGSLGDILRERGIELLQDALQDQVNNFLDGLF